MCYGQKKIIKYIERVVTDFKSLETKVQSATKGI